MNETEVFNEILSKVVILPKQISEIEQIEDGLFHTPYEFEKQIKNCFTYGDVEGYNDILKQMANGQKTLSLGTVSKSPLMQLKYACITFGAIAIRSSIEGGLLEMDAYNYSDMFLRKIDDATNAEQLSAAFQILHKVLYEIKAISVKRTNNIRIIKCQNYIQHNINKKITRNDLMRVSGLTASYLSAVFKKETGKSISEYIMYEKIHEAQKYLLKNELSIPNVSYLLGFCSQSHFTEEFKKIVGITPKKYQDSYLVNGIGK